MSLPHYTTRCWGLLRAEGSGRNARAGSSEQVGSGLSIGGSVLSIGGSLHSTVGGS